MPFHDMVNPWCINTLSNWLNVSCPTPRQVQIRVGCPFRSSIIHTSPVKIEVWYGTGTVGDKMVSCNNIQWDAKPLQYLTPNQDTLCPGINCGNFTLLWWEQIKYKPLAITLSPGSCDFAYILQRYIHFKTLIPLQQFCTLYSLHWNQVFFGYVWSYKQTYTY